MLDKYKDENEFYSLIGIKDQTFTKIIKALGKTAAMQKAWGGKKIN